MQKEKLIENLESLMKSRGFSMKSLSLGAGLNETAVRDILRGRVASPTYLTLFKLAGALNCTVEDIVNGHKDSHSKADGNMSIDKEFFLKIVPMVDGLVRKHNLELNSEVKAKLYLAWYELALHELNNGSELEGKFMNVVNGLR